MHTLVYFVIALVAASLLLMALLVLLLIQITNLSLEDESRCESAPVGPREPSSNPSCTGMRKSEDFSAGGWPDLILVDQLRGPAGEPSGHDHPGIKIQQSGCV